MRVLYHARDHPSSFERCSSVKGCKHAVFFLIQKKKKTMVFKEQKKNMKERIFAEDKHKQLFMEKQALEAWKWLVR